MADFQNAIGLILRHEGGYSWNKNDHGQETAFGISRVYWPKWSGWPTIDTIKANKKPNESLDSLLMDNSTLMSLVKSFYKANFWNPLNLDKIKDQQIANAVVDFGVNAGTGRSARLLQKAVGVLSDGIIGDKTIEAVNSQSPAVVLGKFNELRKDYYDAIIQHDPTQGQFKASWYSRITPYKSVA